MAKPTDTWLISRPLTLAEWICLKSARPTAFLADPPAIQADEMGFTELILPHCTGAVTNRGPDAVG